jgi:hypothetical protein
VNNFDLDDLAAIDTHCQNDLEIRPSLRTLQAPQSPFIQPMCVLVSPSVFPYYFDKELPIVKGHLVLAAH